MPRIAFKQVMTRCVGSCAVTEVSQTIALSLNEAGAGDAPALPRSLPMLSDPNAGLIYSSYEPNAPSVVMRANQPYYVAIIDVETQRILIDAFIEDPTSR